jgi:hypothetical protein
LEWILCFWNRSLDRGSDLELNVRPFRSIGTSDCADHVTHINAVAFSYRDFFQIQVKGIESVSMAQYDGRPVSFEWSR